jgi:VanZ family protein
MVLIFLFFPPTSALFPNTFHYLEPILRFIFPHITSHTLLLLHQLMRKLAHVAEYAILSYFWFRALNQGERTWFPRSAVWALALSISYALLDEYHQTFVPSRAASLVDVGIDSLGALTDAGLSVYNLAAAAARIQQGQDRILKRSCGAYLPFQASIDREKRC